MAATDGLNRYREITRLGTGGMATVTLATDTLLQRPVALKRVRAFGDPRGTLRLKREALVGASLSHPNLVSVYDAQLQDDGDLVIVMEYVRGGTLADLIRAEGRVEPQEALRILRGIAAALDAIHARGIVHRDVKPANVLLGPEGDVKLADLGVADVTDRTRITSSGAIVGSFSYMAPEQLEGAEPGPKMDIYALAAVAYELLGGQKARPEPNPLALAHAISTRPAPDLTSIWADAPRAAAAVLRRGMSADPAQRPASPGELVDRLERALAPAAPARPEPAPDQPVPQPPPRLPRRPQPPGEPAAAGGRRRRGLVVPLLAALAAFVVVGAALAALTSGGGSPSPARRAGHRGHVARPSSGRSTPRHKSSTTSATASGPSTRTAPAGAAATTPSSRRGGAPAAGASASAGAAPPVTASTPGGSSPVGAVEGFYEAAAHHQYPAAWALADSSMRTQVVGYDAFQNQMSSVRSITFHRAQMIGGGAAGSVTVAVRTTSVQTDRTQQCSGTARAVRSGRVWLLDGIGISCV